MVKKRKAFTLAELMVSAAVLAVTLPAMLSTFISCLALNEVAKQNTIATEHLRLILEEMRSLSAVSLLSITSVDWDDWLSNNSNFTLPAEQVNVSYPDYDGDNVTINDDPLAVKVEIRWRTMGRMCNMSIFTLFTAQ